MHNQPYPLQDPFVTSNSVKCGSVNLVPDFLHLLENQATAILLLDKRGKIIYCSEIIAEKTGVEKDALSYQNIDEFIPFGADKKRFRNFTRQILNTGQVQRLAFSIGSAKKTPVPVTAKGKCFQTFREGQVHILCLITLPGSEKISKHGYQHSQGLLGVVSHELRTPLAVVLSATWLAEKSALDGDPVKMKKYLDQVRASVQYLGFILDEFLADDSLENGNTAMQNESFNLPDFCEEIKEQLNTLAKEGQQICYEHTGEEMIVQDKKALHHILLNLLSNALKYSPKNSIIEMKSVANLKTVSISVTDHGIGIPEKDHSHIFSRFYRSDNAADFEGTGLGLSISGKYAELMKGKISFTSELNKGSVFTFIFPVMPFEENSTS